MAPQNKWPTTIATIYAAIYATVIFITGVWSAWQVWQREHGESEQAGNAQDKHTDVNDDNKREEELVVAGRDISVSKTGNESGYQLRLLPTTAKEPQEAKEGGGADVSSGKESQETGTSAGPSKRKMFASFVTKWWELFHGKSEMYLLLVPHIFDQATDAGAIYEFFAATAAYGDLTEEEKENTFDPTWFSRFSVFIFVFQRFLSSVMVYFMTNRNWKASLQQVFDVLILKAIWVNYDLGLTEPCNPQLYIELLEATFESAPQLLLSTGYLLRQMTNEQTEISTFIVIQVFFSLYSLSAKIASDDKPVFAKEYQDLVVKNDHSFCMKRDLNYKWFLRVVCWRFLEITCRFCILLLIWFGVGGLSMCVIIAVEICIFSVYGVFRKRVDLLVNVLYLMMDSVDAMRRASLYRVFSSVTILVVATIFVAARFEAVQVPEFSERHDLFVRSNVGFAILIYAWIAQFIWPCFVFYFSAAKKIEENKIATRSLPEFVAADRPKEALQLLKFGVLFVVNKQTLVTLHLAAAKGHTEVVKYLVKGSNFDCNQAFHGKTALCAAAERGQTDIVKYLVEEANADCNPEDEDEAEDEDGWTRPLVLAAREKKKKKKKKDEDERRDERRDEDEDEDEDDDDDDDDDDDEDGWTRARTPSPLLLAARQTHIDVVKYLVATGKVDCNQADEDGWTPLHWAAEQGQPELVKYLVATGKVDCNQADKDGWTPLHLVAENRQTELVKYLVANGNADCNQADKDGWTPLHLLAENGQTDLVEYLVANGNGQTPLEAVRTSMPMNRKKKLGVKGVLQDTWSYQEDVEVKVADDGNAYFFKKTSSDKKVRKIYFSIKVKRFTPFRRFNEFSVHFNIFLNWILTLDEFNEYLAYRKKMEQNPLMKPKWQPKFRPRIDFVNSIEAYLFEPVFYPNQGWYRVMTFPDWVSEEVCGFDGARTIFARFELDCELIFFKQRELRSFPLDCQDFTIMLRESNGQMKAILMPEARYSNRAEKKASSFFKLDQTFSVLDEWEFFSTGLEVGDSAAGNSRTGSAYSEVTILFKLARRWTVYGWNVVIYFFVITLMAVFCFALDSEDIGERLNLAVVILLTLVAFQHTVFAKLPNIPYLTFLHKYIITSFVFVCLVIVETAMSSALDEVASIGSFTFDVIASWCFGLFWLSYHVFFLLRGCWNRNRQRHKLGMNSVEIADMIPAKYPNFMFSWQPLRSLHDTQKRMAQEQNADTERVMRKVFWDWQREQLDKVLETNQEQAQQNSNQKAVSLAEFSNNGDILAFASYAFDCESKGTLKDFLKTHIFRYCRRCCYDCECCSCGKKAAVEKSVQDKQDQVEQHKMAYRRQSSAAPQTRAQTAEL